MCNLNHFNHKKKRQQRDIECRVVNIFFSNFLFDVSAEIFLPLSGVFIIIIRLYQAIWWNTKIRVKKNELLEFLFDYFILKYLMTNQSQ